MAVATTGFFPILAAGRVFELKPVEILLGRAGRPLLNDRMAGVAILGNDSAALRFMFTVMATKTAR